MDVHFTYRDLHFVWNAYKAVEDRTKHRVEFEAACQVCFDDLSAHVDASVPEEGRAAVVVWTNLADCSSSCISQLRKSGVYG